jgi:hypothetical protein
MTDLIFSDDAFGEDSSSAGEELNFNYIIMRQLERCSFFLSKIEETPAYVWAVFAKPETNFDPLSVQPHKSNFVHSVISLESLLINNVDPEYRDAIKKLKELYPGMKDIKLALARYKQLIKLMKRQGLLPAERR